MKQTGGLETLSVNANINVIIMEIPLDSPCVHEGFV